MQDARRRFEQAGIDAAEAAIDADVLARHALGGWERGQLLVRQHDACPAGFAGVFEALGPAARAPRAGRLHHRPPGVLEPRHRGQRPACSCPARKPSSSSKRRCPASAPHRRSGGARPGWRGARARPHRRCRHRVGLHRGGARALAAGAARVVAIDASDGGARRRAAERGAPRGRRTACGSSRRTCWPA
ncbi:MAG: hypothetical protein M0C28_13445 [Candidatus Moduliflexus flocculans]|nr:hypothetical protein [Candidatus Moduliflexus flocculans]